MNKLSLLKKIKKERKKVKISQNLTAANMFLDKIFSNLKVKKSKKFFNYTFYYYNNELIAQYHRNFNHFFYHYAKIYLVLHLEFKLNDIEIYELMSNKIKKHLKFNNVFLAPFDTEHILRTESMLKDVFKTKLKIYEK